MPRQRSPNRDKARDLWISDRTKKLKDIAGVLGVSEGQVRKWKSEDGWERDSKGNVTKQNVTIPEPVIDNPNLNAKQIEFCLAYIKYFNGTKAYQLVYKCNYSTAATQSHRLLKNPKILEEITRLKNERKQRLLLDGDDILQKQIDIAFASITDYVSFGVDELGKNTLKLRGSHEVDGSLIQSITEGREGVNVKLMDKTKALDFLSKHYGMLGEDKRKELQQLEIDLKRQKYENEDW